MIKKRSARMAMLACASVAALGLLTGASPAAAKTVTKTSTVSQCVNGPVSIPDVNPGNGQTSAVSLAVPITVPKFKKKPQDGVVTALSSAGVRITHTADGDLDLVLVSPGGRATMLANGRGGGGDGYGTGAANCGGSLVQFGDAFGPSILAPGNVSPAPVTGSFKPEQPLSGLVGGPARGNWTLVVVDDAGADVGTFDALSLSLTYQYKALKKGKKKK